MLTLVVLASFTVGVFVLFRPALVRSPDWRATITPLASIIGSGFLVVVPLLAATVGAWAPLAMAAVVAYAYAVGWALRLNIRHAEPLLARDPPHRQLVNLERLSDAALGLAYVVSVAFYLRLLAAFVLRPFGAEGDLGPQALTTLLLFGIALVGVLRGLAGLEMVEVVAVTIKLGVIAALLAGFGAFVLVHPSALADGYASNRPPEDPWTIVRTLAGMLLVVQGFETSRYLGSRYSAERPITSMRRAQLIATASRISDGAEPCEFAAVATRDKPWPRAERET
ncbi:MAG: hypothetical protein OEM67_05735 [Thermoleophilia bacterium]|nr:hypothetical protein [Thermoleophilia bacterium]MDH3725032.1 hypothetical protein [Thermoleophilia bacterium]